MVECLPRMCIRLHLKHSCVRHTFKVNAIMPTCLASLPRWRARTPLSLESIDWPDWWTHEPLGSFSLCLSHRWGYRLCQNAHCMCLDVCECMCLWRCMHTCPCACRSVPEADGRCLQLLYLIHGGQVLLSLSLTWAPSFLLTTGLVSQLILGIPFLYHECWNY